MRFAFLCVVAACGDNLHPSVVVDAPPLPPPDAGIVAGIELPLIESADPSLPFNTSREVTVAAHAGRVVVASVNEHFADPNSFDQGATFTKRVGINVSTDSGRSFGSVGIDPLLGEVSTDPVIRAAADGTFFLGVAFDEGPAALAHSTDGTTWAASATNITAGDKDWFAIDDANQQVFFVGRDAFTLIGFDGSIRNTFLQPGGTAARPLVADGYADAAGAHFAVGIHATDEKSEVDFWDGVNPPSQEVAPLDSGPNANEFTTVTWSRGPFADGTWSVRALRAELGSIVLRIESAGTVTETPITVPSANAFFPTAVMDASGRLHVAYYDSSGTNGVLAYTHSRGVAPFADGFVDPTVVDPDAVPSGFYPFFSTPMGGRRLREYIGIAVDEAHVYIAWTHAPGPPSRVHAIAIPLD